jgi:hypothetical protein
MVRLLQRASRRSAAEAGFLLPLSLTGSLVLLLSSLSMQTAALHGRHVLAADLSRARSEDLLASSAQRLVTDLQGPYRCLLPLPSSSWQPGALPADCPAGLDPHQLQATELWGHQVLLSSWQPSASGGELRLQLGTSGLQRRYALTLRPAVSLQERGA